MVVPSLTAIPLLIVRPVKQHERRISFTLVLSTNYYAAKEVEYGDAKGSTAGVSRVPKPRAYTQKFLQICHSLA